MVRASFLQNSRDSIGIDSEWHFLVNFCFRRKSEQEISRFNDRLEKKEAATTGSSVGHDTHPQPISQQDQGARVGASCCEEGGEEAGNFGLRREEDERLSDRFWTQGAKRHQERRLQAVH